MNRARYYLTLVAVIGALLATQNFEAVADEEGDTIANLVTSNRELQDEAIKNEGGEEAGIFKKKKIGIIEGETEEENFDVDKLVAAMSVYSALGYGAPPIGLLSALLIANGWKGSLTEMATLAHTIEGARGSQREFGDRDAALAEAHYRMPAAIAAPQSSPAIKFVSTPYFGRATESFAKPI